MEGPGQADSPDHACVESINVGTVHGKMMEAYTTRSEPCRSSTRSRSA